MEYFVLVNAKVQKVCRSDKPASTTNVDDTSHETTDPLEVETKVWKKLYYFYHFAILVDLSFDALYLCSDLQHLQKERKIR